MTYIIGKKKNRKLFYHRVPTSHRHSHSQSSDSRRRWLSTLVRVCVCVCVSFFLPVCNPCLIIIDIFISPLRQHSHTFVVVFGTWIDGNALVLTFVLFTFFCLLFCLVLSTESKVVGLLVEELLDRPRSTAEHCTVRHCRYLHQCTVHAYITPAVRSSSSSSSSSGSSCSPHMQLQLVDRKRRLRNIGWQCAV